MTAPAPRAITFQPDIYDAVDTLLSSVLGAKVLDLGAGEGYYCQRLQAAGFEVEACDYLEENFKCPNVPFYKADLNQVLPIPDASYDVVVSIEVAEHIENHFTYFREALRILRPGGLLIISTPNVLSIPSRFHFFLFGFTDCQPKPLDPFRTDYFMQHINPISLPELMFHFERYGATLETLTTNRLRKSAWPLMLLFYPVLWVMLRKKLLRRKEKPNHELHRRHIKFMLTPANLMGRITIAAARKLK